jgi:hypothetical protein
MSIWKPKKSPFDENLRKEETQSHMVTISYKGRAQVWVISCEITPTREYLPLHKENNEAFKLKSLYVIGIPIGLGHF